MRNLSNLSYLSNLWYTPAPAGGDSPTPPDDYVAKYLLDWDATDEGGTYDLTNTNAPYTTPSWASQQVAILNGTDADISWSFANPNGETEYSISFFVYPTSLASWQRWTEKNLSGSFTWNNDIDASNVNIAFRAWGTNYTASYAKSNFSINTWYHIILEFQGNTSWGVKLYVNNVNVASSAGTTGASLNGDNQKIYLGSGGSGADAPTARAACHLGLYTVFDRLLTSDEKTALYNEGTTALNIS